MWICVLYSSRQALCIRSLVRCVKSSVPTIRRVWTVGPPHGLHTAQVFSIVQIATRCGAWLRIDNLLWLWVSLTTFSHTTIQTEHHGNNMKESILVVPPFVGSLMSFSLPVIPAKLREDDPLPYFSIRLNPSQRTLDYTDAWICRAGPAAWQKSGKEILHTFMHAIYMTTL